MLDTTLKKRCGYIPGSLCNAERICSLMEQAALHQEAAADDGSGLVEWADLAEIAMECPHRASGASPVDVVHISDVRAFKSCRVRWNFTSPIRRHLESRAPRAPLWLGRGVHYALSVYYGEGARSKEAASTAFKTWADEGLEQLSEHLDVSQMEKFRELKDLGDTMIRHYALWANSDARDNFKVLVPEVRIQVPLRLECGPALFVGTSDMLIEDAHGDHWLFEHKTAARFPRFDLLGLDDQSAAYVWGITNDPKFRGIRPKGVIFNFLRKKKPVIPKRLKHGGLSTANIDTSAEVYELALQSHGLDASNYVPLIERLRKEEKFFRRAPVLISDTRLEIFEQNLLAVAEDMICDPDIYPAQDWAWFKCSNCPFSVVCQLLLNGADPEPLLEANFRQRKKSYLDYNGTQAKAKAEA